MALVTSVYCTFVQCTIHNHDVVSTSVAGVLVHFSSDLLDIVRFYLKKRHIFLYIKVHSPIFANLDDFD